MGPPEALRFWYRQSPRDLGRLCNALQGGLVVGAGFFALLVILRLILRRPRLAVGAMWVLLVFTGPGPFDQLSGWVLRSLVAAVILTTMLRFGLLPIAVAMATFNLLYSAPPTFDLSAWYAGSTLLALLSVVALAGYGFHVSLAGRPLFRDDLAD